VNAFVTGATGLLGGNLARLLVAQGHSVKALVRSKDKAAKLFGNMPGITFIQGDMEDVAAFTDALRGSDILFHTAAYFREYYGAGEDHWSKLEKINITGTMQLLEAAERAGVRKTIYVSSSGVIGTRADGQPGDETTPPNGLSLTNLYFRSKIVGEERIAEFVKTHTMPVVLILPTWMYGPYDAAPTGAGQMVQLFLKGELPFAFPGGSMTVDARDVAQAMITAVECGKNGERYIIGGEYRTIAEVVATMSRVSGLPAPRLTLPRPIALGMGWVNERVAQITGGEPLFTVEAARTIGNDVRMRSDKAMRELNARFRPYDETMRDTVVWMRQQMSE
jgi:dihydroflavonol-4-reductase